MTGLKEFRRAPGARTFGIVWIGQLVSNLGSSMTGFGLAIWVYQETGSATQLALILMASRVPMMLVSPFAGALVDRWDRRWAMILADAGAAMGTFVAMILIVSGNLETWHLYLTLSFSGLFQAFQFPAYGAAVTTMIPKEFYARASGLVQLAGSIGNVVAPAVAAALVISQGLGPLFVIDFVTFLVAVITLLFVRFPQAKRSEHRGRGVKGLTLEAREGLRFVLERRGLLILLASFLMVNFAFSFQGVLVVPLLLNLTTEQLAGIVVSIGAAGIVLGSLAVTVYGVPKNRIRGVYWPIAAMGVGLMLMGMRPLLGLVIVGTLLMNGTHPTAGATSQSSWQSKVPEEIQGRVFAIRQVSAIAAAPLAFFLAGTLADRVFEPGMAQSSGLLTSMFGAGPGRGIGVMFVLAGITAVLVVVWALRHPRIRNLETEVPDVERVSQDARA